MPASQLATEQVPPNEYAVAVPDHPLPVSNPALSASWVSGRSGIAIPALTSPQNELEKVFLNSQPEMIVSGSTIQVVIPDSKVIKTIEKSVSFSSKVRDTKLKAYQTTKSDSKIKAHFAFDISKKLISMAEILYNYISI